MNYYFLEKDLTALADKIEDYRRRILQQYAVNAEATDQSSETYHDNYGYEEGMRQVAMMIDKMQELSALKVNAKVVTPQSGSDRVRIGSKVTVEDLSNGEQLTYKIGSYMCLQPDEGEISYHSPIAKILLEARVGDEKCDKIGSVERCFRILGIE
jgi:transcription elongation GreA/GreB family factor